MDSENDFPLPRTKLAMLALEARAAHKAMIAEREACASLAEDTAANLETYHPDGSFDVAIDSLRAIAHAIRGRSE
jgi:hypothetical protein